MISKLKQGRGVAIIVAVAILTSALVLVVAADDGALQVNDEVTPDTVLATVNGVEIMQKDVTALQAVYDAYGMETPEDDAALEDLITQEVLQQAAELAGYMPLTRAEAEEQLELMIPTPLEDFRRELEEKGLCYDEQLKDFGKQLAIQEFLEDAVEVPEPTTEEVEERYDYYRQVVPEEQLPPFEQIKDYLIMELKQEKQQEAMFALIEELTEEADIEYA